MTKFLDYSLIIVLTVFCSALVLITGAGVLAMMGAIEPITAHTLISAGLLTFVPCILLGMIFEGIAGL